MRSVPEEAVSWGPALIGIPGKRDREVGACVGVVGQTARSWAWRLAAAGDRDNPVTMAAAAATMSAPE
jgi:hypothetical protein